MNILIMAGGKGTRFYPLSTIDKPKQFMNDIFWLNVTPIEFSKQETFLKKEA